MSKLNGSEVFLLKKTLDAMRDKGKSLPTWADPHFIEDPDTEIDLTNVSFGTEVLVEDLHTSERFSFLMLSTFDVFHNPDSDFSWVSCDSPVAKALLRKKVGETAQVVLPKNITKTFKVLEIKRITT